jgi:hypothetical protein
MVENEVNTLCSQYGLKPTNLSEITLKVKFPDESLERGFNEEENSLYLPLHENGHAAFSLSGIEVEIQACIQFVLDPKKANSEYLSDFLNNSQGLKIRRAWRAKGLILLPETYVSSNELNIVSSADSRLETAKGEIFSGISDFFGTYLLAKESGFAGKASVEDLCAEIDENINSIPGQEINVITGTSPFFRVNIDSLMRSKLYLPEVQTQLKILEIKTLTKDLISQLSLFERRLSTYPKNIEHIEEKLELIREAVKLANDSDYILELIRRGESKKLEFKSTLRRNLISGSSDWNVEHAVLKTVIAYLNTDGGTLLVGVSNSGEVLGIENDDFLSEDKFLLHFKQLVKEHIGLAYAPLIEYTLVPINGKKILKIDCRKSDEAVFLKLNKNEEEFYLRIGPSSERLTGSKLIEYVNRQYNGKKNN